MMFLPCKGTNTHTTMSNIITGLHHVTALASDAQLNVDFYAGILGLRMVKKTINFDAPDVYHLYYGNEQGAPGTIMTFFPYHGIGQGRKGKGQLTVTSFSIPVNALDYWMKRLRKFKLSFTPPEERFAGEQFIYFEDNDGLGIELVANDQDLRPGFSYGQIPSESAVKGFYGVSLAEDSFERTAALLIDQMNHKLIAQKDHTYRFSASGLPGDFVDIIASPESPRGISGAGTVHHLAFATPSDNSQLEMREKLRGQYNVTPVLDRQYFHSIYFREPGGILFEVATHPPGFAVDEAPAHLGEALKLPSWVEPQRESIENGLTPIVLQPEKFMD